MTNNKNIVPEGWQIKTLGQIGVFLKGKGIAKSEIVETGKPCIRYGQIYSEYNYFVEEFKSFIDETSAKNSEPIFKNDLLFAGSGETLEDIGKCVAYIKEDGAYAGGDIIILRPQSEDAHYLGYLLNADAAKRQTFRFGQGHSVVHIYSSSLKKLKVSLPPLPEQQKIAKILASWDKAIDLKQKQIVKKKEFKKAVMKKLLTGEMRFEGFTEKWEEIKLGTYCETFSGGTPSRTNAQYYSGDIPFIKSGDLNQKSISKIDEYVNENALKNSSAKVVEKNTLLLALYGATAGVVAITNLRAAINQAVLAIIPNEKLNNRYLYFVLNEIMPMQVQRLVQGGQPNLNGTMIKKLKIRVPTFKEQQKIAFFLSEIDKEINALDKELLSFQKQKQGLMQQLLTGKVRVKN